MTQLPFEPKCIATGSGWFCAGGDNTGRFASFRLPSQGNPYQTRSVDPQVHVERLGTEIINSISIHALARGNEPNEVVAVLTNNDCSVKIYSLSRDMEMKVDDFPFPVNHASISPDGRMMMIVGDQEFVYFYELDDTTSSPKSKVTESDGGRQSQWELLWVFELHKPPRERASGYFTTAWSPSGKLCACASEHGYIVVFDVESVNRCASADQAVVAVIPSSEPCTVGGAVRCMQFAPEPWDLLLWTEHSGHFVVADLRNGLRSRQVVKLDSHGDHVTRISLTEFPRDAQDSSMDMDLEVDYRARYQLPRNSHGSSTITNDVIRPALEQQQRMVQGRTEESGTPTLEPMTDEERRILSSIRIARQREITLEEQITSQNDVIRQLTESRNESRTSSSPVVQQGNDYLTALRGALRRHDRLLSIRLPNDVGSSSSNTSATTATTTSSATTAATDSADAWRTLESAMQRTLNTDTNRYDRTTPHTETPLQMVARTRNLAEAERWLLDWRNNRTPIGTRQRRERMRETLRESGQGSSTAAASQVELGLLRGAGVGVGGIPGRRPMHGHEEMDPTAGCGTTGIAISECGRKV